MCLPMVGCSKCFATEGDNKQVGNGPSIGRERCNVSELCCVHLDIRICACDASHTSTVPQPNSHDTTLLRLLAQQLRQSLTVSLRETFSEMGMGRRNLEIFGHLSCGGPLLRPCPPLSPSPPDMWAHRPPEVSLLSTPLSLSLQWPCLAVVDYSVNTLNLHLMRMTLLEQMEFHGNREAAKKVLGRGSQPKAVQK